jgi:ABC-type glycerol-3-phosphate transport system permease component
MRRRALNRSYGGDAAIYIFLLICGIFIALPMVFAISNSLKPLNEFWVFPPRFFVKHPTFNNFVDMFNLLDLSWVPFSRYVFNTVIIALIGTAGHVLLASMCAFAFAKYSFRGSKFLFQTVVLALMFNTTVTAIPNFIIMSRLHWVDTYFAVIVPTFAGSLGLYLMKQFMETMIPDSLIEAAEIDGANKWYIFWKIAMPNVRPAWLTLIVFTFQGLWNSGSTVYIQSEQLKTVNYALSQIMAGGSIARAGAGAAATVVMMLPPMIVFMLTQSNIVATMATSGMKD